MYDAMQCLHVHYSSVTELYCVCVCVCVLSHNLSYSGTQTVAYVDSESLSDPTIRHTQCEYLLPPESPARCQVCKKHGNTLRAQLSRHNSHQATPVSRTDPSSHVSYQSLTEEEKIERMRNLHEKLRQTQKQRDRLKAKLAEVVERQGVEVDSDTNDDLCNITRSEAVQVTEKFPPGSFQRIFWEQQVDAISRKDARGMRWHPLMIRWCLYLRHRSSGAYETLRNSGCLVLPSQRTLRDYTHFVKAAPGFSTEVDQQLMTAAGFDTLEEWQKCVVVLLDEMHIRQDLVYEKHSGALIGFANLGEVNNHLVAFERSMSSEESSLVPLAKTMMTFMVRGLFTSLHFPYAQFPCAKVTGDLLFDPFWDGVFRLERCGFKVCVSETCMLMHTANGVCMCVCVMSYTGAGINL